MMGRHPTALRIQALCGAEAFGELLDLPYGQCVQGCIFEFGSQDAIGGGCTQFWGHIVARTKKIFRLGQVGTGLLEPDAD